jgi:hypothetical protein
MSVLRINTDSVVDMAILQSHPLYDTPEVFPRKTRYGYSDAAAAGLTPVEAVPDVLVPKDSFKEVIQRCEAEKSFPIHHMYASWCPPGNRFNQNGLGYCWTWSGTACVLTVREAEGKPFIPLAPVSMGYLVNWANQGNYLESFIKGAREQGICPGGINDHSNQASKWNNAERAKYRINTVWDTNARAGDATMIQHCLSILSYGRPLYGAWNWWGHAVAVVAIRWDESALNNIVWVLRNSHNEDDVIELTGSRGVPDEAYGFIDTILGE